jgi:hypothetical protein
MKALTSMSSIIFSILNALELKESEMLEMLKVHEKSSILLLDGK